MKKFNEWVRSRNESNEDLHPFWWQVYDSMIRQDGDYMKHAPSKEVQEICNQTLVGSGWDPKPNDKREIDRMAEYCLDMLKARGI